MSTHASAVERKSLSPKEYAEAHGICRATVYNLIAAGQLESFKIRRARRIPADARPTDDER
jgi:excisionase family DNA binding protein